MRNLLKSTTSRKAKIPPVKESDIQRSLLQFLSLKKIFHFRVHQSNARASGNKVIHTAVHTRGVPDIILVIDGKFIAVEVKTLRGRLSPDQEIFKKNCEVNNAEYWVIRSVDELVEKLAEHPQHHQHPLF
jgi:hypothetical protein